MITIYTIYTENQKAKVLAKGKILIHVKYPIYNKIIYTTIFFKRLFNENRYHQGLSNYYNFMKRFREIKFHFCVLVEF